MKQSFIKNQYKCRIGAVLFLLLAVPNTSFSHDIAAELENMSGSEAAFLYLKLGFMHILPLGLDHILFILGLYLLNPKLKPILWQATAFTIAHSISLGLSMYKIILPPAHIVEPVIALSIVYVALENVWSARLKKSRIAVVFIFGLIHGMGFANALGELGLPGQSYLMSLFLFNLGVELGQATVILAAWILIGKWFAGKPYYHSLIVRPLSLLIGVIALYWAIERLFY